MADITLPLPGESPNWGTKLNTAILRINQELEALGVRVSVVESGLSSLTLRVTNLEGRVTDLEDNLEDVVRDIAADVIANDPTIIQAAEDAVQVAVADLNIVQAYPEEPLAYTTLPRLAVRWTTKNLWAPVPANVTQNVEGNWVSAGNRQGDVPVLRTDGRLHEAQIPPTIARLSDIPDAPDVPEIDLPDRLVSSNVPIFAARLAIAKLDSRPLAVVFAGSSSTYATPGFTTSLGRRLQETWRGDYSSIQRSSTAEFSEVTSAGVHVYNAGVTGTLASTYLDNPMMDKIAAMNPGLINHMIGSNDWYWAVPQATYKANLEARLDYLDAAIPSPHQHVLVHQHDRQDDPQAPSNWQDYADTLQTLADERPNVVFLDLSEPFRLAGGPTPDPLNLISGDGVHLTARGYQVMVSAYMSFYFA